MEIQQSPLFAKYLISLGWTVVYLDKVQIYIRHFPFMGALAKIQRPKKLPNPKKLIPLLKKHKISTVACEPDSSIDENAYQHWIKTISKNFKINTSPYLPTKTILVDLKASEEEIFNRFSEAKRRAVRRAQKNNIIVKESNNINELIHIKNKSAGFLGFITTYGIDKLWPIFAPKNAAILLAYKGSNNYQLSTINSQLIAGVLLLFYDQTAYYWIAGATREGKKLFAPTLLVWEALKLSKINNMNKFDFVGVWDERKANENHKWRGFTKFKEGFGGKELYYPVIK